MKTNAKKLFIALAAVFSFTLPASSQSNRNGQNSQSAQNTQNGKILVAYFSRTDENYSVGYITEGNTAKIAKLIAEKTGADLFEIKTARRYDRAYSKATQEAKTEQENKERPALLQDLPQTEIARYDTIFVGYPIWWGDFPMAVYTFLEGKNLDGKTIIPFCTHEGSGLSGTERTLRSMFPNSAVKSGLAVRGRTAQNDSERSEKEVDAWLKSIGF